MTNYRASGGMYDLDIQCETDVDLDSTFLCTCLDTGEKLLINGCLFTFDLIED